jgi:hypothetical protein
MKITEHNLLTGETTERDQTDAELAQVEADKAEAKAQAKAQTERVKAKQAVLDRLGITADEAALLLG